MEKIRLLILKFLTPFTKWVGKIQLHETAMPDSAFDDIADFICDGDVLLSRKMWALSNVGIPGFYKHATIYLGGYIYEAVGEGVRRVPLAKWLYTHDFVCVMRSTFCLPEVSQMAAVHASKQVGLPYDYQFEPGVKAFYCSELVYWAYQVANNNQSPFVLRKTFGVDTIQPQDFRNATDKFQVLWENFQ